MLCDDCGKNDAHIHITQIGPNGRIDKNLCETCAANYGAFPISMAAEQKNVSMHDFLKGILSQKSEAETSPRAVGALVCPHCSMSFQDFQESGRIGCSVCYDTFRQQLEPIIRRVHGSTIHSGKIPRRSGGATRVKHEIEMLRRELKNSISKEEYEKAAEYRDRIRALENELGIKEGKENGTE